MRLACADFGAVSYTNGGITLILLMCRSVKLSTGYKVEGLRDTRVFLWLCLLQLQVHNNDIFKKILLNNYRRSTSSILVRCLEGHGRLRCLEGSGY